VIFSKPRFDIQARRPGATDRSSVEIFGEFRGPGCPETVELRRRLAPADEGGYHVTRFEPRGLKRKYYWMDLKKCEVKSSEAK
jgi:hypothetical protein